MQGLSAQHMRTFQRFVHFRECPVPGLRSERRQPIRLFATTGDQGLHRSGTDEQVPATRLITPGSSNGRTAVSDAVNRGSNPFPGSIEGNQPFLLVDNLTGLGSAFHPEVSGKACVIEIDPDYTGSCITRMDHGPPIHDTQK